MDLSALTKNRGKAKARVGLDIGSHSIKILEISNAGGKPKLTG